MDLPAPALAYLETVGLIRIAAAQPDLEYLFRHALVQDAAYDSLLRTDRRRLHRYVGEVLEALYPDQRDEIAAVLARHFQQASDTGRALAYFTRAGDQAQQRYARAEAESHYRAALALAPAPVPRAGILRNLGEAIFTQGRHGEAIALWREAVDLCTALGERATIAAIYQRMAEATLYSEGATAAVQVAQAGLAQVSADPDIPALVELLQYTARVTLFSGRVAGVHTLVERALAMARRLGDPVLLAGPLTTQGLLPDQPLEQALAAFAEAIAIGEAAGRVVAISAHHNCGTLLIRGRGALVEARDHFLRALGLCQQWGLLFGEFFARTNVADVWLGLGEFAALEAALPALREILQQFPGPWPTARLGGITGQLAYYQGDLAAALAALAMAVTLVRPQHDLQLLTMLLLTQGEVLLETGDHAAMEAVLLDVVNAGEMIGLLGEGEVRPRCLLSTGYARQGRLDDAAAQIARAAQIAAATAVATTTDNPLNVEFLALARARLALAEGRVEAALAAFATSTAASRAMGKRWYEAHTRWEWGWAAAPQDPWAAQAHLAAAEAGFAALGCPAYAARVAASRATLRDHADAPDARS